LPTRADYHAVAVDISDLQPNQFLAPDAGGIEDEQPNPMQLTGGGLDKTFDFFSRQDLGQPDRPFGNRHVLNQPRSLEGS
jgi:hypothetical protein